MGCFVKKNVEVMFRPLPHHVFSPKLITNAIFDYDKNESYNLMEGIRQLSLLKCENLELRFYDYISLSRLTDVLKWADDTTLRDIEIMLQYGEDYTFKNILNIRLLYPRLRKVSIVNSPKNRNVFTVMKKYSSFIQVKRLMTNLIVAYVLLGIICQR